MIFKDEFLNSMPLPRTYPCDPHKHQFCSLDVYSEVGMVREGIRID